MATALASNGPITPSAIPPPPRNSRVVPCAAPELDGQRCISGAAVRRAASVLQTNDAALQDQLACRVASKCSIAA